MLLFLLFCLSCSVCQDYPRISIQLLFGLFLMRCIEFYKEKKKKRAESAIQFLQTTSHRRSSAVSQCTASSEDITQLKANLVVLVSRVLCKYIKCLQKYTATVASHIPHIHSKEMAKKTDVVVLDVLHKDETKGAEMIWRCIRTLGRAPRRVCLVATM